MLETVTAPSPTRKRLIVISGSVVLVAVLIFAFFSAQPSSDSKKQDEFGEIPWIQEFREADTMGFEFDSGDTLDAPVPSDAQPSAMPGSPWGGDLETRELGDKVAPAREMVIVETSPPEPPATPNTPAIAPPTRASSPPPAVAPPSRVTTPTPPRPSTATPTVERSRPVVSVPIVPMPKPTPPTPPPPSTPATTSPDFPRYVEREPPPIPRGTLIAEATIPRAEIIETPIPRAEIVEDDPRPVPRAEVVAPPSRPASTHPPRGRFPVQELDLVPPRVPSPGVLARTRGLITSHQFVQSLPEDAAQDLSLNLDDPTSGIVQVTRDQAIAFARFLTRDLQQQGVLRRNQYFRLPLRSETASQQIWRDEDVASINEARPFGLVLEEGP